MFIARNSLFTRKIQIYLICIFQLYSEFAERYQLAECKLAISHGAGVYNEPLITALWQNIVEYGTLLSIVGKLRNFI